MRRTESTEEQIKPKEDDMRRLVVALVTVLALAMAGPASSVADSGKQVQAVGGEFFEANRFVKATFRFAPGGITVTKGDRVTFVDRDDVADVPHTVTIVNKADLPTTIDEVFGCTVCVDAIAAHDPGLDEQPPFIVVVNKGKSGLDTPGDSLLFAGPFAESIRAKVTAAKGTTLDYLCAIHPWMQGSITVD